MRMKFVKLLHNPGAGEGSHSGEDLAAVIESAGFSCQHDSIKTLRDQDLDVDKVDILALAGGDGTIRKAAKQLIEEDLPIGLFPMGTANNIARTLGIHDDPKDVVNGWKDGLIKRYDVGKVTGVGEETFFLEGFGFGVFPMLIEAMKNHKKDESEDPHARLKLAVEMLHEIVQIAPATFCKVTVDGADHSGRFLLIEVMNTRFIGPNLNLSPGADPGDGKFEVVLLMEEHRKDLLHYLMLKAKGVEKSTFFKRLEGTVISFEWEGTSLHVDDEKVTLAKPVKIDIALQKGVFKFLVPQNAD
jgi:diacylglycerol kinase (ATP)